METPGMLTLLAQDTASTSVAGAFFIQRHPATGDVEWLGSGITWLLMAMSVVCLALLVTGALRLRRSETVPGDLVAHARSGREAAEEAAKTQTLFGRVLACALAELVHSDDAAIRAAEQEGEAALLRRMRAIEPLSIVGNVSPMIGLFGTVYGMIVAFREIVASGGTPDAVGLAAGIGTALTTTFWGLVVAIPALAGHALLRNRAEGLVIEAIREAEAIVEDLGTGAG
ncbi:MAG: MotA/TolQ/ExbB proton channel family protein [Phycisphaerales bacterium]